MRFHLKKALFIKHGQVSFNICLLGFSLPGINCKQVCCLLVLFAGIFVTLEPTMLVESANKHLSRIRPSKPNPMKPGEDIPTEEYTEWYYALIYALSWLPFSFWLVWTKYLQKKYEVRYLYISV
jgi:hypothetical protein